MRSGDYDKFKKNYVDTNEIEIRGLVGLWINLGLSGYHHVPLDEIFSSDKASLSLDAHLCFTRDRYKVLMRALRFDDKDLREKDEAGKWKDKFVHIREVCFSSTPIFLLLQI